MTGAREAARLAGQGANIFIAGCASEPLPILAAVQAEPQLWADTTLWGTFIPGVNDRDFTALGLGTTVRSIFATPGLRPGRTSASLRLMPLHYSTWWQYLAAPGLIDIAYVTVPPPRDDGTIGLGITADFAPAPIAAGARLVGVINPAMPDVARGPRLPLERFEALVEHEAPLPAYDAGPLDPATRRIAAHVAGLLRPGDTLQLGLGKVQSAILDQLAANPVPGLAFHAGMVSAPIRSALEAGVFDRGVTCGVALGDADFYRFVGSRLEMEFAPVGFTHAQKTFSKMARFISVNSVLEVDLYGQANGEFIGGRQISGHGGMVDFIRGSRQSEAGVSILALPSTGRGGTFSRIVSTLPAGIPVTVARSDVDVVVTEHGIADLRHADTGERAERLIGIADPVYREELHRAWKSMS